VIEMLAPSALIAPAGAARLRQAPRACHRRCAPVNVRTPTGDRNARAFGARRTSKRCAPAAGAARLRQVKIGHKWSKLVPKWSENGPEFFQKILQKLLLSKKYSLT